MPKLIAPMLLAAATLLMLGCFANPTPHPEQPDTGPGHTPTVADTGAAKGGGDEVLDPAPTADAAWNGSDAANVADVVVGGDVGDELDMGPEIDADEDSEVVVEVDAEKPGDF